MGVAVGAYSGRIHMVAAACSDDEQNIRSETGCARGSERKLD